MQEYNELVTTDACNTYLEKADKNIQSVASTFSGTAFPTTNLAVGMQCMRTDDSNNIYKLTSTSPVTWELVPSKSYVDNAVSTGVKSITNFKGAASTAAGAAGLVPAPAKGQQDTYYLSADGTWKQVQQRTEKQVIDIVYPVGSIWETTTNDDPNILWAGTTWVKMDAGRVLVAAGSYTESGTTYTYNLGDKGGEAKHQLSTNELANHSHGNSCSTASLVGTWSSTSAQGVSNSPNNSLSGIISGSDWSGDTHSGSNENSTPKTITINATHSHSISISSTGSNASHENRQPYTVVNRWKRTA
jgi:microcystin-dependent protein